MIRALSAAGLTLAALTGGSPMAPEADFSTVAEPVAPRVIRLNDAPALELELVHGVGPVVAGRLVAARPFADWPDVDAVPGIGPALLARLRQAGELN